MGAGRTAKVVVAITGASTAVGAFAGVATAGFLALVYAGPGALLDPEIHAFAGGIGAACGAVLGPAAAFGFMRRVPLGRLFAGTAAGAVAGGIAGFVLGVGLVGVVGAAALGFTAAAARLAWSHRRPLEPDSLPPAG
jgi:hypothetical protein